MKLSISKHELNEAIQQVAKAVSSRPAIPILSGIKIEVTHMGITLTASDTDISIQSYIPVEKDETVYAHVDKPGNVVLPAKFFVEMIKKLPSDQIYIEVDSSYHTLIRSGSSEIQLVGLDPEEFPILPSIEENEVLVMPGELLKTMIRQTVFAASVSEQTPILTGVMWSFDGNELTFVSTDRHRLANRITNLDIAPGIHFNNVVISAKTMIELSKLVPEDNHQVEIVVADNQVLFKFDNLLFFTRILDGTYPDTSKIIPTNYKTELVFDTKSLIDAIDRAYLLSREEKTNIVRLATVEDGSIEISSSSTELGKVREHLEPVEFNGDPLRIAFNSKYMLDVLKVLDSEQLFIGFTGAMSPIVIRPLENDWSKYVILPYRTTV